jgi:hypothetical protein
MATRLSGKRLKGIGVYVPRRVHDAWLDNLTAKEIAMGMLPPSQEELSGITSGDRRDFDLIVMQMPKWWVEWYRSLSKEEKFIFGRLVERRLRSVGLIGGVL